MEKFSVNADSISFTWNTTTSDLGSHIIKAFAYNATDTVYYKEIVNVAEWISQASGFTTPSRAITYMSAVDSNIVWGTASDGNNLTGACSDFTRTVDGGNTWTSGVITNTTGLSSAMIFAMDENTAYAAMYRVSGSKPMGIYTTTNGGTSWTRQTSASFSNANSFPDVVHFFNPSDGVAMGDPINNKFEIYTTSDGGSNWTLIGNSGNPAPITGEYGVVGYYSAVHDTIWFGTNMGRVYKSVNKGATWTVSAAPNLSAAFVKPVFRDGTHGLLLDESSGNGVLCESSDGGTTWTTVTYNGPNYAGDIAYVPGTPNTWVRSGNAGNMGCAYSFDGGHNWTDFIGTTGSKYYQMTWVNNHCGWSGGVNATSTENGVYKYIGKLQQALPSPLNVMAAAAIHDVDITWSVPNYNPGQITLVGYNISRNGTKINATPVTGLIYTDQNVISGHYTYCVSAQYIEGSSHDSCSVVDVAVGLDENNHSAVTIFPNPAHDRVVIKTTDKPSEILLYDGYGKMIQVNITSTVPGLSSIDISGLHSGIYLLSVGNRQGIVRTKLVVY